MNSIKEYEPISLEYPYDALEQYIDARTMDIHYNQHYKGYIKNLNKALDKYPDYKSLNIAELIRNISILPQSIRKTVRDNAGGVLNHEIFFRGLKKDTTISGALKTAIESKYNNIDNFKEQFSQAAMDRFGSGWVWLANDRDGNLYIVSTPNQDTVIEMGLNPIMGNDLWEHAYYLKYQNRKNEYVNNYFQVINWDQANNNYLQSLNIVN